MDLDYIYEDIDDIPTDVSVRDLFTKNAAGKWELTGVKGVRTTADFQRIKDSLEAERTESKKLKASLKTWTGLGIDADDLPSKLERLEELEALSGTTPTGEQLDDLAAKKAEVIARRETAKLRQQLREAQEQQAALTESHTKLTQRDRQRTVEDEILRVAKSKAVGVRDEALQDAFTFGHVALEVTEHGVVTKAGIPGVEAGLTVEELFKSHIRETRPHWFPDPKGTDARGGRVPAGVPEFDGGVNPYAKGSVNVTAQMAYETKHGPDAVAKAKAAAARAEAT